MLFPPRGSCIGQRYRIEDEGELWQDDDWTRLLERVPISGDKVERLLM